MKQQPESVTMNLWEDHETEQVLNFQATPDNRTFFHVLRKRNKVTFSVRQVQELMVKGADEFLYKNSKPLTRWVTLISFSVAISKRGRLSSFLSRKASPRYIDTVSLAVRKESDSQLTEFFDLFHNLTKKRTRSGRGVVNSSSYTYGGLLSFQIFLNLADSDDSVLSYESPRGVDLSFLSKEIQSLLRRNNTEREQLNSFSKDDLKRYIAVHSYPLAKTFEDLPESMKFLSYDGAEAVAADSFEGLLQRVTYRREEYLKQRLKEHFWEADPKPSTRSLARMVNCLTVTKSYVPDNERLALFEKVLHRSSSYYEPVTNESWDMLRLIFRSAKNNSELRGQALEVLSDMDVAALSKYNINQLYLSEKLKEIPLKESDKHKDPFGETETTVSYSPMIRPGNTPSASWTELQKIGNRWKFDASLVPPSWSISGEQIVYHLLKGTSSAKHETLPVRAKKSYMKHFSYARTVGFTEPDIDSFLQDERDFLSRKLSRLSIKADPETLQKLLVLSLAYWYRNLFEFNGSSRKVANIPNKVFFAIRDRTSPELIHEVILTKIDDYDTIKETFGLIKDYRHAILDIQDISLDF